MKVYVVVRVTPDSQEPRGVYESREDADRAAQAEDDGRFTSGEVYEFDVQ